MLKRGIGIGRGIAIGPVLRMADPVPEPPDETFTGDRGTEWQRVAKAISETAADLLTRAERAGGEAQTVLEALADQVEDPSLADDIQERILQGKTAERATFEAFEWFHELLADLGGYQAERAADLDDLRQRVIAALMGVAAPGVPESSTPYVLVAHELAPADTALLDLSVVLAFVTTEGGPTSHTAILARAKSITAVVGVKDADELIDGVTVIVDAEAGTIISQPSSAELTAAQDRIEARDRALRASTQPGALADGTPVPLLANLGSADEAAQALNLGAEGVGLFRTELLFLDAETAPSRAEQVRHYSNLLRSFSGKKVVVRVLDAGADKPLAFLNSGHEQNPALGLRGLRALRVAEGVLRDQLSALAEADAMSNAELWVMAPMVADAEETEYFVDLARECGIRVSGVMAEIPSLAVVADQALSSCDFLSIGTNDLTQYTLAADRLLGSVAPYQDPWHPAVLRLIAMTGEAGRATGKPVGVCGEAAADPLLAVVLVGLGVTSLSMAPSAFADVRMELSNHTLDQAKELATLAVAARTATAARDAVSTALHQREPH